MRRWPAVCRPRPARLRPGHGPASVGDRAPLGCDRSVPTLVRRFRRSPRAAGQLAGDRLWRTPPGFSPASGGRAICRARRCRAGRSRVGAFLDRLAPMWQPGTRGSAPLTGAARCWWSTNGWVRWKRFECSRQRAGLPLYGGTNHWNEEKEGRGQDVQGQISSKGA